MSHTKVPPHSIEAEMAVLGAMLIEKDVISTVTEIIQAKHFYSEIHRRIFESITDLYNRNQPVDIVTLSDELKKNNKLEELGGQKYLSDLMEKVSTAAHTQAYAQLVKEKALLRELIRVSTSVIEKSFDNSDEVENILDYAQEQIIEVAQTSTDHGFSSAQDLAHEVLERLEKAHGEKSNVTGVPTGFTRFDDMTSGLQKSDLIILAARPSQGKTAMALNMAYHAAVDDTSKPQVPVAIFSLEMDKHAIFQRMLCSAAGADLGKVRKGYFPREVWTDLTRFSGKLAAAPLWIDDTPGLNILDIRARTRKLQSQLKNQNKTLGLIIIDYLQLIRGTGRLESRQQEVSEISRLLKDLARSLKVPVLALSQLNRRSEDKGREGNRPQLSDLRESGSLEQDADVVALIHRPEYYNREDPTLKNKASIILAKQRNGPVGEVELYFRPELTRFENPQMPGTEIIAEEEAML
ncbi:MAG: replicative DNA helicase [Elusimicrobia bacterium GWA2_56_46]|nr:MAG: replicative DNA helicase [Elusimicrobia bacterium GWA2_56_46]OGR54664.1 MAG: replicative DNA helicase [Elusimicrobia bacterium GWC2_56_31]HBB66766.1 replicative DNA helicase [Elusimicrobiota bacterium]HBW21976.1 replicative DNA helicase [Elusimicrobiota bacterium]